MVRKTHKKITHQTCIFLWEAVDWSGKYSFFFHRPFSPSQSFFGLNFGGNADVDIILDGQDERRMAEIKDENGRKERLYLFYDGESVTGKVRRGGGRERGGACCKSPTGLLNLKRKKFMKKIVTFMWYSNDTFYYMFKAEYFTLESLIKVLSGPQFSQMGPERGARPTYST